MKRITFARLAVLMLAVAGLALQGCGGDDNGNGGTSPEDQARITQLEEDLEAANTKAEEAEKKADDAVTKAEEAEKKAEEAGEMPDLAASWEAIAGKAIEDALADIIGTGSTTVTAVEAAIESVAATYGLDATSALELLNQTYPQFERLRAVEVTAFLTKLHADGHLAATRDAVAYVLTGPKGDTGDTAPGTLLAMAWETIAGDAIKDDLAKRVGKTGAVSHTALVAAIKATGKKFGLAAADVTATLALLEDRNPTHEQIRRVEVTAFLKDVHEMGYLAATEKSATYVIAMQAGTIVDKLPGAVPRSVAGIATAAAKAVAKMIEDDLTGEVLNPTGNVWSAINTAVMKYRGTITNAELGPVVDAAIVAGMAAARADGATAKTIAAAVQAALATAYMQVASATGDNLPQTDAQGMLMMATDTTTTDTTTGTTAMSVIQVGGLSMDADDYPTAGFTKNPDGEMRLTDTSITYSLGRAVDGFAGTTSDVDAYGAWAKYHSFGVLKGGKAYSVGTPTGAAPIADPGETLKWTGVATGYLTDTTETDSESGFVKGNAMITVTRGASTSDLMAEVKVDNLMDTDGDDATTLTGGGDTGAMITWSDMKIGATGAFGTGLLDSSYVSGRFYGSGAKEAGGVFKHIFGEDGAADVMDNASETEAAGVTDTDTLIGAFGAEMMAQ